MGLRNGQCEKVCRIIDDVLANRSTERDSLIVAVQKAFKSLERLESASPNSSESPNGWILCSKRMPDRTGMYEVTYKYVIKHFDSAGKHFKDEIIYLTDYDNWKQFSRKWKRHGDTVIAWRNTSKPYQPKEDES